MVETYDPKTVFRVRTQRGILADNARQRRADPGGIDQLRRPRRSRLKRSGMSLAGPNWLAHGPARRLATRRESRIKGLTLRSLEPTLYRRITTAQDSISLMDGIASAVKDAKTWAFE